MNENQNLGEYRINMGHMGMGPGRQIGREREHEHMHHHMHHHHHHFHFRPFNSFFEEPFRRPF